MVQELIVGKSIRFIVTPDEAEKMSKANLTEWMRLTDNWGNLRNFRNDQYKGRNLTSRFRNLAYSAGLSIEQPSQADLTSTSSQ